MLRAQRVDQRRQRQRLDERLHHVGKCCAEKNTPDRIHIGSMTRFIRPDTRLDRPRARRDQQAERAERTATRARRSTTSSTSDPRIGTPNATTPNTTGTRNFDDEQHQPPDRNESR